MTQPHTYGSARINNVWQTFGDGVRRGPDPNAMSSQQAGIRWYPIVGASVRSGFNSMPTGDAIVITAIRTWVQG